MGKAGEYQLIMRNELSCSKVKLTVLGIVILYPFLYITVLKNRRFSPNCTVFLIETNP